METRDDILNELKEIAPQLALLTKTNPYILPDNYFLNFGKLMLEKVKMNEVQEELKALAPELAKIEKQLAFVTAEKELEYFNNFPLQLMQKIRSEDVANELAAVAPM